MRTMKAGDQAGRWGRMAETGWPVYAAKIRIVFSKDYTVEPVSKRCAKERPKCNKSLLFYKKAVVV